MSLVSDKTIFFMLSLSSVLILIVQESRPVFLVNEQKPHTATWRHVWLLTALLQWCLVFPQSFKGKLWSCREEEVKHQAIVRPFILTAPENSSTCMLIIKITNVSSTCSHPSLHVLFQLQSPVQFLQFLNIQQHSERFTIQRQVQPTQHHEKEQHLLPVPQRKVQSIRLP